ncbi:hypothetical protein [Curtobacterium sp. 20TX0008]|uniref:hypothetical protein n=1 Tax=Curtobacterium sp. 20TX0008 TaxID=3022018 RepID=UPI00232CDB28|nr:hypothetical protein [Curtobacterium sp. 20TX0008]MDB6425949.1 hypothetical protein [Curtobacterium sp. 20TX0008]
MAKPLSREALEQWQASLPKVYALTELTGRKKDREVTTYVVGVEVGKRSLIAWLGGATLVGLPLGGAMSWILATVGLYQQLYLSLIPIVLAGSASVWLFVGRERRGLRLLRYQGLVDRRRAARSRGRLFVGTKAVQPATVNILIPVVIDTPIAMLRALDDTKQQPARPTILDRLAHRSAPTATAVPSAWDEPAESAAPTAVPDRWSADR